MISSQAIKTGLREERRTIFCVASSSSSSLVQTTSQGRQAGKGMRPTTTTTTTTTMTTSERRTTSGMPWRSRGGNRPLTSANLNGELVLMQRASPSSDAIEVAAATANSTTTNWSSDKSKPNCPSWRQLAREQTTTCTRLAKVAHRPLDLRDRPSRDGQLVVRPARCSDVLRDHYERCTNTATNIGQPIRSFADLISAIFTLKCIEMAILAKLSGQKMLSSSMQISLPESVSSRRGQASMASLFVGKSIGLAVLVISLIAIVFSPTITLEVAAVMVRLSPAAGIVGGGQVQQATDNGQSKNATFGQAAYLTSARAPNSELQQQQHQQQQQQQQVGQTEARGAGHWSLPNRPSLFSIIRFPNEECFDSSNQSGTCYTAFECKLLGGQPSSPCAAGFGSCCIVSRTCHVTTREKVVYFKNPSYPSADSDEKFCDLTVEMSDISVCQLRLDFLDFQLDPPTNGACKDDYMEISASGMPPQTVPRLCGLNRNQHLYINLPQDLTDRSASIVFYTDPVGDHRWQVKVTQIDCNQYRPLDWKRQYAKFATSPLWNAHPNAAGGGVRLPLGTGKYSTTFASGFQTMSQTASALAYEFLKPQFTPRAPMGCLQYFTEPSGIIESFNFGQYLNNMDYSICIRRQPDTCRVVFTSSDYDWSLNGVGIAGSSSGVGDQDCARDYLLIPGASRTGDGFTYDRYCGGRLNYYRGQSLSAPVVMKTSGPIVLRFHSDAHFESVNNGGFRLQYDQSTQDCIYHTAEEAGSLASQQLLASTLSDSRPLMSSFSQDAPALYASQQLGTAPIVHQQHPQQLNHVDYDDLQHPVKALIGSGTGGIGNTNDSNGSGPFHLAAATQQATIDGANQIKRRHDDDNNQDDNAGLDLFPAANRRRRPVSASQQATNNNNNNNNLLLGDLSKAFQLITARNARAMRHG